LYSVCSNINTEVNIYHADGFNGKGWELNHWTSLHCVSDSDRVSSDHVVDRYSTIKK